MHGTLGRALAPASRWGLPKSTIAAKASREVLTAAAAASTVLFATAISHGDDTTANERNAQANTNSCPVRLQLRPPKFSLASFCSGICHCDAAVLPSRLDITPPIDPKRNISRKTTGQHDNIDEVIEEHPFSEISTTVLENMKNLSFPAGGVILREGEPGNSIFFVKSGLIEIETKDGFRARLGEGDTFGEGSLLHPGKPRSATVKCVTAVELVEISQEFATKYLLNNDTALCLKLREMDRSRGLGRAASIIGHQENLKTVEFKHFQPLFRKGDRGDALYLLEEGRVEILGQGGIIFSLTPGEIIGEESLILGKPRNSTATCSTDVCKLKSMSAGNFHALLKSSPELEEVLRDLSLRRDFQRAIALKMKKEHHSLANLKDAFDMIDSRGSGFITVEEARDMLSQLDTALSDEEITDAMLSLDADASGKIGLEEFKNAFAKSRVHDYPLQRRRDRRVDPNVS